MPRKQPMKASPPLQETPDRTSAPADSIYRALLVEESTAYSAWFFYSTTQYGEAKEQLSALRHIYEEKRGERQAYQPSDHPLTNSR